MTGLLYDDGDGKYPVIEWRVFYPDAAYCSCRADIDEIPESGVQAVAWFIWKDNRVHCHIENGKTEDHTVYNVAGRKLSGTMMEDGAFYELWEEIQLHCTARVKELKNKKVNWGALVDAGV